MELDIYQVDAFSARPFSGNPAGVCITPHGLERAQVRDYGLFGPKQLVVVDDAQVVRALQPDFQALRALPGRGVAVTAPGDGEYDMLSRYFAPWVGVNEDPVTGSAHCALAAYWSERLGKRSLTAYQASRRGGVLALHCTDDGRVLMSGAAHTVLAGTLRL